MSKSFFKLILFLILFFSFFDSNAQNSDYKKGDFYTYWCWNWSWYSKSDIHFKGDNYDFKIHKAKAQDRQSEFSVDTYLNPANMTIPQYNFRFGYFIKKNVDISFGIDHLKYVVEQNQIGRISGFINNTGTKYDGVYNNTLLPIRESDKIRLPFAIEMSPYNKPILLVKSKHHLKEKFKWDISTKVFIYTSSIRQILTNYLSDRNYSDCPVKKNFLDRVMSNAGMEADFDEIPEYFDKNKNINIEAVEWIEHITAGCIDTPVQFKGRTVNYLKIFEEDCIRFNQENTHEN